MHERRSPVTDTIVPYRCATCRSNREVPVPTWMGTVGSAHGFGENGVVYLGVVEKAGVRMERAHFK